MALCSNVLLTIVYTAQFKYPLTTKEVWLRLVGAQDVSLAEVQDELDKLVSLGVLKETVNKNKLYSLNFLAFQNQDKYRVAGENLAFKKSMELTKFLRVVKYLPWISAVAVTGSMALNQSDKDGDLDFLIVAKAWSMWLVRPILFVYSWIMGKRRTWQKEEGNSWCFNLWLEEDHLALGLSRHNLYSAYEVCQAKWVYDRNNIKSKFIQNNSWVRKYLPNYYQQSLTAGQNSPIGRSSWLINQILVILLWPISFTLNLILYFLQKAYMKRHITREEVSLGLAFFHPRDTRRNVGQLVKAYWYLAQLSLEFSDSSISLVTGVFDVLHQEHKRFLLKAQQYANKNNQKLVVAIEQDERVRQMKGDNRPVNNLHDRISNLRKVVKNAIVIPLPVNFENPETRRAYIYALKPKALLLSSHTLHQDKKQDLMSEVGGIVQVVHEFNPKYSTTLAISQMSPKS